MSVELLVFVFLALSLVADVFSVGLDASLEDVTSLFRRPVGLIKAVVAVNLVVPAAGALLIAIFPLSTEARAAIMLMAVSPVPPMVPQVTMKSGARRAYAYGVYVALVVLSVAMVPLMVELLARVYGVDVHIGPAQVAGKIGLGVLLPLAIGMGVRAWCPAFAARAAPHASRIAFLLVALAAIVIIVRLWPKIAEFIGNGMVAAGVLMAVAGLVAGYLAGGPDPHDRSTLAVSAAMRHPGIAMMIANANAVNPKVSLAIMLVLLSSLIAIFPYRFWLVRHARRQSS
jgi:BASS family bile acid:Na+ symporter